MINKIKPDMSKKEKIEIFKELADSIRNNITARKRPLIVEFSGLPKAGKTTVVNSLALFLRRNKIPTAIITERATICPIKSKEHPDFNIWTSCSSLINMLDFKQNDKYHVIIIDRGIFDTLIWLSILNKRGKLNAEDLDVFRKFLTLDRWVKTIDLVICMKTSVEKALEREFKDLLTDIDGSIMNDEFLNQFLTVMDDTVDEYKDLFHNFTYMDTTETDTLTGVGNVISKVITCLEELSNEQLITIPRDAYTDKINILGYSGDRSNLAALERVIKQNKIVKRRSEAEESQDVIQLVVCTVITYKNLIAIITKKEIGDKRLHDKKTIWAGGHFQHDDADEYPELTVLKSMKNCLRRELAEEFELDYDSEPTPIWRGLVYDNTHHNSVKHLGVVFQVDIKDEIMMKSLNNRLFSELSGQGNFIEFVELKQETFNNDKMKLEPWSVDILKAHFDIDSLKVDDSVQTFLF